MLQWGALVTPWGEKKQLQESRPTEKGWQFIMALKYSFKRCRWGQKGHIYFSDLKKKEDVLKTAPEGCKLNGHCSVVVWWFEPGPRVWQSVFSCSVSAVLEPTIQAALFCPRWHPLVSVPRSHPWLYLAQKCSSSSPLNPPVQRGCWRILICYFD